jgi:hypothetical protein
MPQPYGIGKLSDSFKHSNLERLVAALPHRVTYVELHSGPGKSGDYEGSALRVLKSGKCSQAYLHEKDPDLRARLQAAVAGFPMVEVRGKWQESIGEYREKASDLWLFLFDPTHLADYGELLPHAERLARRGAHIFLWAPESIGNRDAAPSHRYRIKKIRRQIGGHLPNFMALRDLYHPSGSGWHGRRDHNIVVSYPRVAEAVEENHELLLAVA